MMQDLVQFSIGPQPKMLKKKKITKEMRQQIGLVQNPPPFGRCANFVSAWIVNQFSTCCSAFWQLSCMNIMPPRGQINDYVRKVALLCFACQYLFVGSATNIFEQENIEGHEAIGNALLRHLIL